MKKIIYSFGNRILDTYGDEFLQGIWSNKNEFSPFEISDRSNKDVVFVCDNGHEFTRKPYIFWRSQQCPVCKRIKSSIGSVCPESIELWSNKNELTPYDYSSCSSDVVWWKCNNHIHEDYKRNIKYSKEKEFQCPKCAVKSEHPNLWNRLNLNGVQFGELEVLSFSHVNHDATYWNCRCSCGSIVVKNGNDLKAGKITTCGDRSKHRVGENNSNWKGGITLINYSERFTPEYSEWRKSVFKRDYFTCQCCGASHEKLEAHHINDFATHKDKRMDECNGITLCFGCHNNKASESLHQTFGCHGVTPEQLEEYINMKRLQLGIPLPFSLESYLSGDILKPGDVDVYKYGRWIFDKYSIDELQKSNRSA